MSAKDKAKIQKLEENLDQMSDDLRTAAKSIQAEIQMNRSLREMILSMVLASGGEFRIPAKYLEGLDHKVEVITDPETNDLVIKAIPNKLEDISDV